VARTDCTQIEAMRLRESGFCIVVDLSRN
jgi:hypothetical protein